VRKQAPKQKNHPKKKKNNKMPEKKLLENKKKKVHPKSYPNCKGTTWTETTNFETIVKTRVG